MQPKNLLIIMSDEHSPKALGAAGHPFVRTPNLDALAAAGTRFTAAYTGCPICVPARASLATGRQVHEIGHWDNADAYDGSIPSWHHAVRDRGHRVDAIGKLHFRGLPGDDHGFSAEQVPMYVVEHKGDLLGLIRDETTPTRKGAKKMSAAAGPGESDYTRYDRDIAARAQVWLHEEAPKHTDKPWVLFVSLVTPHFPLVAPPEHFYAYPPDMIPMPKLYGAEERPTHPFLRDQVAATPHDSHVKDVTTVKRMLAGYFGLVSFMDEQVGKILAALAATGHREDTNVLYFSDHGDSAGARGLWGKSNMYEESVGIPMIFAGPDLPAGKVVTTPASLVDVFPTVLEAVGVTDPAANTATAGAMSLFALARGEGVGRAVLSEYHASGSRQGAFMLRDGRWKYVRYVTYPAQLFDLETDPEELHDRADDPACAEIRAAMEVRLAAMLDPAEVDARAKRRQGEILAAHGGAEAVRKRGELPFSPPPGVAPAWS